MTLKVVRMCPVMSGDTSMDIKYVLKDERSFVTVSEYDKSTFDYSCKKLIENDFTVVGTHCVFNSFDNKIKYVAHFTRNFKEEKLRREILREKVSMASLRHAEIAEKCADDKK